MADNLLCPDCHHGLGFHGYAYGVCESPLGGQFSHDICNCPVTVHDLIQKLQAQDITKEFEKLQAELKVMQIKRDGYISDLATSHAVMVQARERINFLEKLMTSIKEILEEGKKIEETRPFYGWFAIDYRNQMHKILERAMLEMEKN